MSDNGQVKLETGGGIATITLDRPDRRNALNGKMIEALAAVCRTIDRDTEVRCVILTGAGKAFCAGGDIDAWSEQGPLEFGRFWVREGHDAFAALARLRQPVIAVLNGHTLGGGLEIAAAADLRIAESHIKIGQPESGLGIIPGWSGTQRAVRRFGSQAVRRMALFGEVFTAGEAHSAGIVDAVVPTGDGLERAKNIATMVVERGPVATEITKMLINAAEGEERDRPVEAIAGIVAASTDDLREGVEAYREKRKPVFRNR